MMSRRPPAIAGSRRTGRWRVPFNLEHRITMTARHLFCLLIVLAGAPVGAQTVSVTTLGGESFQGELLDLTAEAARIDLAGEERSLPTQSLMEIVFPVESPTEREPVPGVITLADQSSISMTTTIFDGTTVTAQSPLFGELKLPIAAVKSIRLAPVDDKVADSWKEQSTRVSRDDFLVFRKGDVLDYTAGAIGKIDETSVTISVRNRPLSAPLERIFGIVFTERGQPLRTKGAVVNTVAGDHIVASSLTMTAGRLNLTAAGGTQLSVSLSEVSSLDYGGGRIRFLADIPFDDRDSKSPNPQVPVLFFTCKNFPDGTGGREPLTIDSDTYRRGLWLHGGAVVKFRLNREFTKFKAIAGFELTHADRMSRWDPSVKLIVEGDGKALLTQDFRWDGPAQPVDLNVADVRDLVIRVESRSKVPSILEHFALGDAQLIQ